MEKEKETKEVKENKFTYSSDSGLKKMSEEEFLNIFDEKEDKSKSSKEIKKGFEQWL